MTAQQSQSFLEKTGDVSLLRLVKIAAPAVLSMLTMNVMQFADRMLLSHYDVMFLGAGMASGTYSFVLAAIFMGTATYVNALVSQYYGANQHIRCARATWQGLYLALASGALLIATIPFTKKLFLAVGHAPNLIHAEETYFVYIMIANAFNVASNAMNGFFNGIGKTRIPMFTAIVANGVNILFDWLLIFGHWGFPELGIAGAAIATLIGTALDFIIKFAIFATRKYRNVYRSMQAWKFHPRLFKTLLRFGFPSGVNFLLGNAAFGLIVFTLGRMGDVALSAASLAVTIESLSFIPVFGLSIGVGVLAGQEIGANRIQNVGKILRKGVIIAFVYNSLMVLALVFLPHILMDLFKSSANAASFALVKEQALVLVRITALWVVFDGLQTIVSSVLRAAGDTVFLMAVTAIASTVCLAIPTVILIFVMNIQTPVPIWICFVLTVFVYAMAFVLRYFSGRWKRLHVIEGT